MMSSKEPTNLIKLSLYFKHVFYLIFCINNSYRNRSHANEQMRSLSSMAVGIKDAACLTNDNQTEQIVH